MLEWGSGVPQARQFSADWDKTVPTFVLHNLHGVFLWKAKASACWYGSVPVTSRYVIEQFLSLSTSAFESVNVLQRAHVAPRRGGFPFLVIQAAVLCEVLFCFVFIFLSLFSCSVPSLAGCGRYQQCVQVPALSLTADVLWLCIAPAPEYLMSRACVCMVRSACHG